MHGVFRCTHVATRTFVHQLFPHILSTVEHLRGCPRSAVTRAAFSSISVCEQLQMEHDVEHRRFAVQFSFLTCEMDDVHECLIYSIFYLYDALNCVRFYSEAQLRSSVYLREALTGVAYESLTLCPSPSVYDTDDDDEEEEEEEEDDADPASDIESDSEAERDSEAELWCGTLDPDWIPSLWHRSEEEDTEEEEEEEEEQEDCDDSGHASL